MHDGAGVSGEVGVYLRLLSAAVAVTVLKVEPGVYSPCVARFSSGAPEPARFSLGKLVTTWLGLKVGVEAIASTRPVDGWIATTAPRI